MCFCRFFKLREDEVAVEEAAVEEVVAEDAAVEEVAEEAAVVEGRAPREGSQTSFLVTISGFIQGG